MKNKKLSNNFFLKFILKKAYVYVINANFNFVNIRNNENISLTILSRKKLERHYKMRKFRNLFYDRKKLFSRFYFKKNLTKHLFFQNLNS